jgi:hypothetical protein
MEISTGGLFRCALHKYDKALIRADNRFEGRPTLSRLGLGFRSAFVDPATPALHFVV